MFKASKLTLSCLKRLKIRPDSRFYSSKKSCEVCIIGSGPAGFYTAQQIIKGSPGTRVSIIERLPVPFGLVRYGVAPDHQEVKNVDNTFTKTIKDNSERVKFIGNVSVGSDVKVAELRSMFDVVILAYGAAKDRTLDIPGENLKNVISARRFVGLYNGSPEDMNLDVDLSNTDTAAVVGLGNVALDVARILLTPLDQLRKTDITEQALDKLSTSKIKKVYIVGRRGPLQVAFTIKELREMVNLEKCKPIFNPQDFAGVKEIVPKLQRPRKRLADLMAKTALDSPTKKQEELWAKEHEKSWELKLLRTPEEIIGDTTITGLKLGINRLSAAEELSESQSIESTGQTETLDCGLLLRSIGYKSVPVEQGIPFDEKQGVIPNNGGRIRGETGLYCAGWLATGPRGVIVDTMNEAFRVGQNVVQDVEEGRVALNSDKPGYHALTQVLRSRNVDFVGFDDWERIDKVEKSTGEAKGKPREKMTQIQDLMHTVKKESS